MIDCDKGKILIPFSDNITFFYGNTGVGKTSLLNLINYALGQDLILTQIIDEEVRAVCLDVFICQRRISIERRVDKIKSNLITVKEENSIRSFLAKGDSSSRITFSDYLYEILGLKPIEMLWGKSTKTVRVTFANYMWYAYLRQDELDNTLFYLGVQSGNYKKFASNYVLHVILDEVKELKKEILQAINGISEKQEAVQMKLSIMKEIFSSSSIFEINIGNEILKKYQMLGQINQEIEQIFSAEKMYNEEQVQNLVRYLKTVGRYEAEIRYLKEFRKISEVKEKYYKLSDVYEREKKEYQKRMMEIRNESFRENIKCLEGFLKESLLDVGFQGFSQEDMVRIDTKSFVPTIYSKTGEFRFDYYNLSSSGIRTIFKICYALSIYRFVKEKKIVSLLPTFIMIDTPMKNISERIDKDIYIKLYEYFYRLFSKGGALYGIQLIIIDKEAPEVFKKNNVTCRMFTKEKPLVPL